MIAAECAVGRGSDLRRDLARVRLRRLRDRRVLAADRRLAGVELAAKRPRARCAGAGALRPRRRDDARSWCTTAIAACSTCRSATPSDWPKPASSLRSAASAIPTTTRSAETVIGLYKTEVIRRRGPWRNIEEVEFATLEWVDWFNNRRLLEPIGNVPPAENGRRVLSNRQSRPWRPDSQHGVSGIPGAVQVLDSRERFHGALHCDCARRATLKNISMCWAFF